MCIANRKTWECRFPVGINMRRAKSIMGHGGFVEIKRGNLTVEVTEDPSKNPQGENFVICFRSPITELEALNVLKEIGGLLCQD